MPEYRHTPVIGCTAYAYAGHEYPFQNVGFTELVSKPMTKRSLTEALDRALTEPAETTDEPLLLSEEIDIELPPLPTTLFEIVELVSRSENEEYSDVETLTRILRRDQVVSLWLLRHVNSAYYGLSRDVTNVDRAIFYMGFRPVCNLVLAEMLAHNYSDYESEQAQGVYEYLMRVGLGAAQFAKLLADELDLNAPDVAYSAGLLCQLGRLLLLDREPERYADLWYDSAGAFLGPPPLGQEILHCSADHVSVTVQAGRQCDLGNELVTAIRHYRDPTMASKGQSQLLALIVAVSLHASEQLLTADTLEAPDLFAETRHIPDLAAQTEALNENDLVFFLQRKASDVQSFVETIFHH